jgi:hypothetical protein
MQNFNDLLNGYTDGTKDLSISALTCAGTATLNGNVNVGNSSADDLTITASLASAIAIKTNNSYDIGSATLGLRKLYLGNGGAGATCDIVSASHATTREYTIPDCGAAASFVMTQLAQTIAGAKTFSSGIVVGGNTTGDSNLGTITSVTNSNYFEGSFDVTFNTGMDTGSTTKTVLYRRMGRSVTLMFPQTLSATNADATTASWSTSGADIPSSLRPATNAPIFPIMTVNAGAMDSTPGTMEITTGGQISVARASNWASGTASCGFQSICVTYPV